MTEGEISYSVDKNLCIFRLQGNIRHTNSTGFNLTIRKLFTENKVSAVVIDLRETTYIDSTNLGLLGTISRNLWVTNKTYPTLFCPENDVYTILVSMGFKSHFEIITDADAKLEELKQLPKNQAPEAKVILDAHETLLHMSENNKVQFESLVELLRSEISADDTV